MSANHSGIEGDNQMDFDVARLRLQKDRGGKADARTLFSTLSASKTSNTFRQETRGNSKFDVY